LIALRRERGEKKGEGERGKSTGLGLRSSPAPPSSRLREKGRRGKGNGGKKIYGVALDLNEARREKKGKVSLLSSVSKIQGGIGKRSHITLLLPQPLLFNISSEGGGTKLGRGEEGGEEKKGIFVSPPISFHHLRRDDGNLSPQLASSRHLHIAPKGEGGRAPISIKFPYILISSIPDMKGGGEGRKERNRSRSFLSAR